MTRSLLTTLNDSLVNCKSEDIQAKASEYVLYLAWSDNYREDTKKYQTYLDREKDGATLTPDEDKEKKALKRNIDKYKKYMDLHRDSVKAFENTLINNDVTLLTLCARVNNTVYSKDSTGLKNFGKATEGKQDLLTGFTALCKACMVVNELKDVEDSSKAHKEALKAAYNNAEIILKHFVEDNYNVDNSNPATASAVFNDQKISVHVGKHGPINNLLKRFSVRYGLNGENTDVYKFKKADFFQSVASWIYKNLTSTTGNDFTGTGDVSKLADDVSKLADAFEKADAEKADAEKVDK